MILSVLAVTGLWWSLFFKIDCISRIPPKKHTHTAFPCNSFQKCLVNKWDSVKEGWFKLDPTSASGVAVCLMFSWHVDLIFVGFFTQLAFKKLLCLVQISSKYRHRFLIKSCELWGKKWMYNFRTKIYLSFKLDMDVYE